MMIKYNPIKPLIVSTCLLLMCSCDQELDVIPFVPPSCGNVCERKVKSSPFFRTEENWPLWCAPMVKEEYECVFDPESDKGKLMEPVPFPIPSFNLVGSGIRLVFDEPVSHPVPIAYLGWSGLDTYGYFHYGRTLTPEEITFDVALQKYTSKIVWGLPLLGRHRYRLPGREIETNVLSVPSSNSCQSVQDVEVKASDIIALKALLGRDEKLMVIHKDLGRLEHRNEQGFDDQRGFNDLEMYLRDQGATRLFGGTFTQSTFVYFGKPAAFDFASTEAPNWYFLMATEASFALVADQSALRFSVPALGGYDLGVVVYNSLCDGLMGDRIVLNETNAQEVTLRVPSFSGKLYSDYDYGVFKSIREQTSLQYNCTYLNVQLQNRERYMCE